MARNPKKNQELREISEQNILNAAIKLFAENGYAGTKTTDVVKTAGISQGLLYHYYPDKMALYESCIQCCIQRTKVYFNSLSYDNMSAAAKIKNFSRDFLQALNDYEVLIYQFILLIRVTLDQGNKSLIEEYDELPLEFIEKAVVEAQKSGEAVEGDAHVLSVFYWAAVKGICVHMMNKNFQYPQPDYKMLYHILLK